MSLSANGSIGAIGAIGAPNNDGNGSNSSHVRVFNITSPTAGNQTLIIGGIAVTIVGGFFAYRYFHKNL